MTATDFQREVLRYERLLHAVAWSMLHQEDACADAIQEALLRAWQHREALHDEGAFKSWLCRILVNTCTDMQRQAAKYPTEELPDDLPAPEQNREEVLALREALDRLEPQTRTMLILHNMDGMPVRDIAALFDVPETTVKSRLFHARRKLAWWLREEAEA